MTWGLLNLRVMAVQMWHSGGSRSTLPCADPLSRMQRALVETHLRQICGLEQQLQQQQGLQDTAFSSLSPPPCADLDLHYLTLRGGSGLSHGKISAPSKLPYPGLPKPNPHFNIYGHP